MSLRYAGGALIVALVAAAALNYGPSAGAQGKIDEWEALVAYAKDAPPEPYQRVALRATVEQPVFVYLRNTLAVPRANVSVKLVRVGLQGKDEVVAEAIVAKLAGRQTQLLAFKPAPPPAPPKGLPPAKDPVEPPGYPAPFFFELWIDDGQKTTKRELPMIVTQPSEYVTALANYEPANNRLSVDVAAKANVLIDPLCAVQLVLNRELLRGLLPPKDASLAGKLTRDRPAVELHATDMQFEQGAAPKSGRVYVNVDGYERAYGFKVTFEKGAQPKLPVMNRVRIRAPRYFVPKAPPPDAPKPPAPAPKLVPVMPVQLEVDGLLNQDVSVEVAFDRNGNGSFARERLFHGPREQMLKLAVGDDGRLMCTPTVKDWRFDLNVDQLSGPRTLRVSLLNAAGLSLALADESKELLLFDKHVDHEFAPLRVVEDQGRIIAITADLFINDTGPEDVRLVKLPAKATPNATVRLMATARKREDPQAPINKVQFFVGDPEKDSPIPAVLDVPSNIWHAEYKVPSTAKETLLVTVKMATSAGLVGTAKDSIAITDPATVTGAIIKGRVVWADEPQPKVTVKLYDGKGKTVLKSTETTPAGVYAFEEVPPGSYILFSSKINFKGARPVTVLKGQALLENQEIELKRN